MLIPVCCFSCGACIAHLWDTYQQYVKEYNQQLSDNKVVPLNNKEEINRRINNTELGTPSAEELAMLSLNIKRMCCRRMFLTQSDTFNLMNLPKSQ